MDVMRKSLFWERYEDVLVSMVYPQLQYSLDSRIGWFIQEFPSLIIPVFAYFRIAGTNWNYLNVVSLSMFVVHYFQRWVL